jgi:F0F1-type ATP synthase epsilon subunit
MNYFERQKQDIFLHVAKFGTDHTTDFPAESIAGTLLADLATVIRDLDEHASAEVAQTGGKRLHQAHKLDARGDLVSRVQAISRTAKVVGLTVPNLEKKFVFTHDVTDRELISMARGFADNVAPHVAVFTRYALPADFLDQLIAATTAFETSLEERHSVKTAKTGTMATIDTLVERGNTILKQLDVIVKNVYRKDETVLAAWKRALRPERQRSKPAAKAAKAATPSA